MAGCGGVMVLNVRISARRAGVEFKILDTRLHESR